MRRIASVAVLVALLAGCTATPVPPSPSPIGAASPSAAPTPSVPPTSPAPASHLNGVLGYRVLLPPPWRVSGCLGSRTTEGAFLGSDVLTTRTETEEHDLGAGGDTGASGALAWTITIAAELSTLSPSEYAATRGGAIGETLEPTTVGGQPAVRRVAAGRAHTYYVSNAGRIYLVALGESPEPRPPAVTDAAFEQIVRSLSFVPPDPRPTATPVPAVTASVEAVVDAVAAAFAAADADRLRELMPARCWFAVAFYQSSGSSLSREKMADQLRTSFAQGRTVTVEPRPIRTGSALLRGPFWVWSTWSAYGSAPRTPQSTAQLVFDQIDGRWYWTGALFNVPR